MISKHYNKTATVFRSQWTTDEDDNDISEEVEQDDTVKGHLQQASATLVANFKDVFTLTHIFWCPVGSDILNGDVLVIDGFRYGVRGIQDNSFIGSNKHLEIQLEKYTNIEEEEGS
jgi:hypothetical protein